MENRCTIFMKVLETGNFTRAARELGYSQSAVSQAVRALERDLGTVLLERGREGLSLTVDGNAYLPYIRAVFTAEDAMEKKKQEMLGLVDSRIRIGTFTSVSRNLLPQLMADFRREHPGVSFELVQGDYTSIAEDLQNGRLDFGFMNPEFAGDLETVPVYQDTMMAVLPEDHPLAGKKTVSLKDLSKEPFIELDEGEHSVALQAFARAHLEPEVAYKVTDDYSILTMVRQSLGVSMLYRLVLAGFSEGVAVRPVREKFSRTIALAWVNHETMPLAARKFADEILQKSPQILAGLPK